jgi:DNA repair protein RAD51/DNA repair protein RadA
MATELSDIDGVGNKTVKSLNSNGINTIEDLADASIEQISECGISNTRAKDFKYKAKQNTISIDSASEVKEENKDKRSISSGLEQLDEYTEGGLSDGEIVAAYGSDGSGKTQLAFQLAVSAVQNDGGPVVWIETERSRFIPQRFEQIAGNDDILDDIYRVKAYDLESQYNAYFKIKESFDEVSMLIVDSLTARFRLTDKFDERSNLSARSSELGKHINALESTVDKLHCPCLVTAQVYDAPTQYSSGDLMWGGSLLKHSVIYKLYMKDGQGDTHEVKVEQHPSTGNNTFNININKNGIQEI